MTWILLALIALVIALVSYDLQVRVLRYDDTTSIVLGRILIVISDTDGAMVLDRVDTYWKGIIIARLSEEPGQMARIITRISYSEWTDGVTHGRH